MSFFDYLVHRSVVRGMHGSLGFNIIFVSYPFFSSQEGQISLKCPNFIGRLQHYKVSGYAPYACLVAAKLCI